MGTMRMLVAVLGMLVLISVGCERSKNRSEQRREGAAPATERQNGSGTNLNDRQPVSGSGTQPGTSGASGTTGTSGTRFERLDRNRRNDRDERIQRHDRLGELDRVGQLGHLGLAREQLGHPRQRLGDERHAPPLAERRRRLLSSGRARGASGTDRAADVGGGAWDE
jgi:hypothetical protein